MIFKMIRFCYIFIVLAFFQNLSAQPNPELTLADEYFNEADFEKALPLYQRVYKNSQDFPVIQKITECYAGMKQWNEATEFLDKLTKKQNQNVPVWALKYWLFFQKNDTSSANQIFTNLINKQLKNQADFHIVSNYFWETKQFYPFTAVIEKSRDYKFEQSDDIEKLGDAYVFLNQAGKAVGEWVRMYQNDPGKLDVLKARIAYITNEQNKDEIERTLLSFLNKLDKNPGFRELVFDFYVQNENYEEAFVQIKAIDKVFDQQGNRVFQFGKTLQINQQFDISNQAFDYVLEKHPNSGYQLPCYQEKNINMEMKAFLNRPVDSTDIRNVVQSYSEMLEKFGRQAHFGEAMYRKANLCVFYLNDLAEAQKELDFLDKSLSNNEIKAKGLLLQGDILLMQGEYKKAELKYSVVEERFKQGQLGSMAKFRFARLAYFRGDFDMSKSYLKILKDNTTNDIANDAIQLYLIIVDNTGLDTTTEALQSFAQAQLLIYQKQFNSADKILDSIQYKFPGHMLQDDILWEKSNITLQSGNMEKTLILWDKILNSYSDGIWGDDVLFSKAEYFDYGLKDKTKAMDLYIKFLSTYPASVYKIQVRKRIRQLRGEKIQ